MTTIIAEATNHNELIEAMRLRKEALGLSNAWIEHAMNLSDGHCDKILGPARERGLSQLTIDGLLAVLAIKLIVVEDEAAAARMRSIWSHGQRDERQVRPPSRISASLIKRATPVVMRAAGRRGGLNTWRKIPDSRLRSRLMSELAKLRWRAQRSASAPVAQQETAGAP
jgi:hypothetical protein